MGGIRLRNGGGPGLAGKDVRRWLYQLSFIGQHAFFYGGISP
jgi:hypothetical protein